MQAAFEGNYGRSEIKAKLDEAMRLYELLPIDENNYQAAGRVLAYLRTKVGVSEMAILDYMIYSHGDAVKLDFAGAATFAAVLAKGEKK